jgi:hypothetical protein
MKEKWEKEASPQEEMMEAHQSQEDEDAMVITL